MSKIKIQLSAIPAFVYLAFLLPLLLSACNSGSTSNEEDAAYLSFSIPKPKSGNGLVTAQQLENVTSIIITVTDDKGNSVSGDIWKTGGKLTLQVKPHVLLIISGVAYESGVATFSGGTTAGPLRPGEVSAISFPMNPTTPPPQPKPDPVVNPGNGASGIALDTAFTVDLSALGEEIQQLNSASLTLTDNNSPAINTVYFAPETGFVLNFSLPDGTVLNPGTLYTASLQVGYTDFSGAAQSYEYSWSFTTVDTLPDPIVVPENNAEGIAINAGFTTDLTPASDNIASLNSASLTLSTGDSSPVTTEVTLPEAGLAINFSQLVDSLLVPGATYTALLSVDYTDSSNNDRTYNYSWTFTTSDLINLDVITDSRLSTCVANLEFQYVYQVVDLDCSSMGISDISGIQQFINLERLNLRNDSVRDISELQYLTNLIYLNLGNCGECSVNNISDLSPISGLTNLQELNLDYIGLSDLTALSSITSMQILNMRGNDFSDLAWAQNLTQLRILNVSSNYNLSSLAGLENLDQLTTLVAQSSSISDISAINNLDGLVTADLRWCEVVDVNLSGVPSLEVLDLNYNYQITSVALNDMPQLQALRLNSNKITSVSMTGSLGNLSAIDLSYNYVNNLDFLANLPALSSLSLNNNNIDDLSIFSNNATLANTLTTLSLSDNNISDAAPVSALSNLTSITLNNNNIVQGVDSLNSLSNATTIFLYLNRRMSCNAVQTLDVFMDDGDGGASGTVRWDVCFTDRSLPIAFTDAALTACVNNSGATSIAALTSLDCSSSNITNLTGIDQLAFLQNLNLSNNNITNFSGLSNLRNLSSLTLNAANMNDVSILSSLKNLDNLSLDSNPFTVVSYISDMVSLVNLTLVSNQITGGLLSLDNLFNLQVLDLSCSPTALENDIIALDAAIDGGDGAAAGVVIWGCE